ncbi:hypothetical protein DQW77_17540 [Roseovarius sp. TE539]|nr:hypothetical protein DQW77_17540 [Roseovarius sp. TE539]
MTGLPIRNPDPAPRETLYSYLARLAATWQTTAPELAYDMGAPFKTLLQQDQGALGAFADWAGLDSDAMVELMSWTGVRVGNVRMQFRGELYISRALRNPVIRGCPVCLREDGAAAEGPAASTMVMRGHWQMREVNLCVKHGHPLVPLWEARDPKARYDIGARLQEIEADIVSGAFDEPARTPSAYDLWLDKRLQNGSDDTWLKGSPVFAITTLCRFLGEVLQNENTAHDPAAVGDIHAAGFNAIAQGEEAIRAALDQIARRATGPFDEPGKVFGKLFDRLNREYAEEDGFDFFRDLLRECILDHWPVAAGEEILGEVVQSRRLHSLRTAARETGIGVKVLDQFLVEAGAIGPDDDRVPNRKLFDAKKHADLLAEIPTFVGPIAMRKAMGATRQELIALTDAGVLVPRTRTETVKKPWRVSDGLGLVAELSTGAASVDGNDATWETLLHACKRRKTGIAHLIDTIRENRLSVGRRRDAQGFHGIVVPKSEVDLIIPPEARVRAESDADLSDTVPAAEFGRSVGLRDGRVFQSLIEAGHVPAQKVMNPRTGRPQYRMTADDIAAFHERFVTLTTLATESGLHRNTLKSKFASHAVVPFSQGGQDFGPVYRRADIPVLTRSRDI